MDRRPGPDRARVPSRSRALPPLRLAAPGQSTRTARRGRPSCRASRAPLSAGPRCSSIILPPTRRSIRILWSASSPSVASIASRPSVLRSVGPLPQIERPAALRHDHRPRLQILFQHRFEPYHTAFRVAARTPEGLLPSVLRPGGPTWQTLVPARTLPHRRLRLARRRPCVAWVAVRNSSREQPVRREQPVPE